jgi:hypothetical protein
MKKSLIALAALAAVSAASAQSTVTISGLYTFSYQKDLSVTHASATTTGNQIQFSGGSDSVTTTAPTIGMIRAGKGFGVTDANFKLAAVEDLGGGLKASFDVLIESAAFRTAAMTRADSGMGLSGGFGAIAFRNTRSSDLIATIYSPAIFLPDGIYDSTGIGSRSAIDTFGYTSNDIIPGLKASLTYVENNNGIISTPTTPNSATLKANSSVTVFGVAYANGPLSVSGAYKSAPSNKDVSRSSAGVDTGLTPKASMELAVSYDLGVAKVAYGYDAASLTGASTSTSVGSFSTAAIAQSVANLQTKAAQGFSVTAPFGAVTVGMNYFKRDVAKLTEFGASYAFSKRTLATIAQSKKDGLTTEAGHAGTQYRVGLRHTF